MRKALIVFAGFWGVILLLWVINRTPNTPRTPAAADALRIADEFTKAATDAADFIATIRDKRSAEKEEPNVNGLLAQVLAKREPYDALILGAAKKPANAKSARPAIPPDVRDRAEQAGAQFDTEVRRFQALVGTQPASP